jgi:ubiquinone/menaquinone biosynthesis C-methylase UbiE
MKIAFLLILIGIILCLAWRFSSRQKELPCPAFLSWLLERDNPFAKVNKTEFITRSLQLEAGMSILDAGCGPGRLTIPIAKEVGKSGKVTAVDMQPEMLKRIQEKATGFNNIDYLQAKIGAGKLIHNQFDRALLATVLGEIPKREAALKEIFDSLKPGGLLLITEVIFDPHFQRKNTVIRLAKQAGFQEFETVGGGLAFSMLLKKPAYPL